MVPVMVVVFNELSDRLLELPRIVVVLQFDDILHRAVIALDLALGHRVVWRPTCVLQTLQPEIMLQLMR